MPLISRFSIIFLFLVLVGCKENQNENSFKEVPLTDFVDPFIGTGGHGHTYPGVSLPFGMVQPSPDNGTSGWDWSSGYHYSDYLITGFSQLHLSGTGIGDLNDILFMPINKKIDMAQDTIEAYSSRFSHKNEISRPGYYQVLLDDSNIEVSLTASERNAYHRYKFPENQLQSVIVDLGFSINWDRPVNTELQIKNDSIITGFRHSRGWANNQKVFFAAQFSRPIRDHISLNFLNDTVSNNTKKKPEITQLIFGDNDTQELFVKIAWSSVSIENAIENFDNSAPGDFEKIRNHAQQVWNSSLSDIVIDTPIDSLKTIFYTALYHTQLAPVLFNDKNGEFRLENDSIVRAPQPVYSTFSLWDTFRAQQPLLTLIEPERVGDMIQSMLAYYEVRKVLPVWTLHGNETNTMTGYHSIPVITEAYFKGLRGFDVEKAYKAMKNTMMGDARGLKFYKKYGYIPFSKVDESVTITLEYAYNDWCVAQMAKALGKPEDYKYFIERSNAWHYLLDTKTGFMRGLSQDGTSWNEPFDPKHSRHRKQTDYTEGNAWQHSWFVLHDTENFIDKYGGQEKFTEALESLFTETSEITGENVSADISGLIGQYAHGNEPSHHIAYLFNRAGKPWRTQFWVRQILNSQYNTTPNGLSGNEDAGQMSAWYVFSSIGLYPFNPASGEYEIGSPLFKKSTIRLPQGKEFIIEAEKVSDINIYIQSAWLNGEELKSTVVRHEDILRGGVLKLVMGSTPNKRWGHEKKH